MIKSYPCINIYLSKIKHNSKKIVSICKAHGINLVAVTKVFCADEKISKAILDGGVLLVGDSRIENLIKLKNIGCEKMLLRIPMQSNAEKVVRYSDISLNSEVSTIIELNKAAQKEEKVHNIILMIDLGDLREGILEKDLISTVKEILQFSNIKLIGIGTNLTCYGGIIPDEINLGKLVMLKQCIKNKLNIDLPIVSGGNSSSIYMVENNTIPRKINQLRIGEAIALGRETAYGRHINECYDDCFILECEIVEVKNKPSVPIGKTGMDAFGRVPCFKNNGIRKRAIVAIGYQDIKTDGMFCTDNKINIIGSSSDHLILDITDSNKNLKVGDILSFKVDYGCLLRTMTSSYVKKYYN